MLTVILLLLVPATALGLVMGMDRLEDSLLKQPARHRTPRVVRTATGVGEDVGASRGGQAEASTGRAGRLGSGPLTTSRTSDALPAFRGPDVDSDVDTVRAAA